MSKNIVRKILSNFYLFLCHSICASVHQSTDTSPKILKPEDTSDKFVYLQTKEGTIYNTVFNWNITNLK